ncbi:MAG: NTP transferase domain-containing protein [Clostridia bacterium]|nr:NTP transferase domain-containing protein [Clostridia bacterium]
MKAVIFNSGLGNRMGEFTKNNHKSMTRLKNGETIFHRQLRLLSAEGITDFIITTGPFEDQLKAEAADFPHLNFTFVRNDIYDKTNYIYSMYLAREHMDDDLLFFHGDLVFNRKLIHDVLACSDKNTGTVNFKKALPEKDFKGRVQDGKLLEVSIHIFDEDCFAFQPFYKMEKATAAAWIANVVKFIEKGENKCYAENALNEIFADLNVRAFSYEEYYIDEIDNLDDYARVSAEIIPFDEADEKFFA